MRYKQRLSLLARPCHVQRGDACFCSGAPGRQGARARRPLLSPFLPPWRPLGANLSRCSSPATSLLISSPYSSAPPSSSSSSTGSKRLVNWSIKNYFSARPSSSTNTPVALGPAQPHLPVIAAAAQPVVASGSGIASDASDSMGQAQSTPKAAAAPRLSRGTSTSRSTSPSKHATTVKGSPLKQTTGTWLYISSDEEPAAVSARQAEVSAVKGCRDIERVLPALCGSQRVLAVFSEATTRLLRAEEG